MIRIGRVQLTKVNGWSRVTADLDVDGFKTALWIEVEDRFANGLCADRSDAFVVGLLSFAFRYKHDIAFEVPITNLLKEQIEKDFIDVVCQHQPEVHHIKLTGPTIAPIFKDKVVRGMGLSCGVDCLYTVHNRMLDASLGERYFLMTDAHLKSKNETDEESARRFKPLYENGKEFADKLGIPLIVARTNWGSKALDGLLIENNTTFCNCFAALALQNLFTHYYLASGGPVCDFAVKYVRNGIFKTDCSNFDLLSLSAYSTPALRFIVDGLEERVTKIRTLLGWPDCWDNLDVCEMHRRRERGNDTYDCHKCMHTVNEILAQGGMAGLEKFSKVFDVDYVKAHRAEFLAYLICQRLERSEVGLEAWRGRAREGCGVVDYLLAIWWIARKAIRKFLRKAGIRFERPQKWIDV